ncbi:hypothetical protein PRZ48_014218 [Zasmidium cellare]|uniref:Uncharacterized protein n=1 Tax=Zasmidium cellare TaxID=395010 RepID=A0ABR0E0B4_ZASCE|nr:hypothetical protein PRZ48_014218 [Zasmidium cellare]
MTSLKHLLPILLVSINGVLGGKKGTNPDDKKHLLGSDTPAGSQSGSGAPSLLNSESGSGSSKSMPAAQVPSSSGPSAVTQGQFDKLFGSVAKAGSCKKYQNKILTAYNEVLAMINAGVDAVNEMGVVGPGGREDENKDRYNELMGPFEAMFGITDEAKQADDLKAVKANYEAILAKHQVNPGEKGPRWQIRCGDDFLEWKDANDPDPRKRPPATEPDPRKGGSRNKVVKNTLAHSKYPDSAWYAANMSPEHMLLTTSESTSVGAQPGGSSFKDRVKSMGKSKSKGGICDQPGTYAVSFPKAGLLVLCPNILDIEKTKAKGPLPEGTLPPVKEWSLAAVKPHIHQNMGFNEYMPTLPQIWLHHMFHYALQWTEGSTPDSHSPHVLGWPAAQAVAAKNQKQALKSPENYAVFGAAMYLSEWRWGVNGHVMGRIQSPAQVLKTGSSGGSGHSDPFKDPDPFQDPQSPEGSESEAESSGSSDHGRRDRVMRRFEA